MQWLTTIFQTMSRPLKWWVVIASWEQGLRVRLGKNTARLDPGIHFRIPFLDRIYVQSTRFRVIHASNQSISTKDGKVITFSIVVRYQIADIRKLYHTVSDIESVLIYAAIAKASKMIASKAVIEIGPREVEDAVNTDLATINFGLEDVSASIINYCISRCYRLMTGDSDIYGGSNMDNDSSCAGEVK